MLLLRFNDFFNILFNGKDERISACQYLLQTHEIELEQEPLAQNAYYIYVDEKLFQEVAVEKGWARINLNYPEYLHEIKEETREVNAKEHTVNVNNASLFILCTLFFLILLCGGIALWL